MIKNYIFDFGGVFYEIDQFATFSDLKNASATPDLIQSMESVLKHCAFFSIYERGEIASQLFCERIIETFNLDLTVANFTKIWNKTLIKLKDGAIDAIKQFNKKGKVFLLSNTNEIHFSAFQKECNGFFKEFDKCIFSFQIGMNKPNTNIYKYLLKECSIKPEESIFIDDSPVNLQGAKKTGLNTVLFDINKPLSQLEELL